MEISRTASLGSKFTGSIKKRVHLYEMFGQRRRKLREECKKGKAACEKKSLTQDREHNTA